MPHASCLCHPACTFRKLHHVNPIDYLIPHTAYGEEVPMFNIKRLTRTLSRNNSIDPSTKKPLTERNVESFNLHEQYAEYQFRRSREVQISEWLRLLP